MAYPVLLAGCENEVGMRKKICRIGIGITLAVVISLVIAVLSYSGVGVTCKIGTGGLPLPDCDLSAVPQSVTEDATELATELFGDCQEKCDDFASQLLAVYSEARDKDFVMLFNPGGWGWSLLTDISPGWWSILAGIESELDSLGYTSLLLNHLRTPETLVGRLDELVEMMTLYPSKAEDLASRVEFVTSHIPDLRIVIIGECNGTVISDSVMNILQDNPRVYSIQIGPPFWHKNIVLDRTLLLNSNGIIPDSFSQGDFGAMIWGTIKALFGLSQPRDDQGNILYYVRAPGHDYWWHHPGVYSQIVNFLGENFNRR